MLSFSSKVSEIFLTDVDNLVRMATPSECKGGGFLFFKFKNG